MRNFFSCLVVMLLAGAIWGCDSSPGPAEPGQHAPVVSNLSFDPANVLLDSLPPGSVVDGIATFSIDLSVDVADADGDVDRLFVLVQSPLKSDEPVASTGVELTGNGRVSTSVSIEIPSGETGIYSVKAFVSDAAGHLGNQVIGSLIVDSSSEPPVIDQIDMPDRITRPAQGQPAVVVLMVAHVSDPDGLSNILRVSATINGSEFNMCDDGGVGNCNPGFANSGDLTAGDGLFTLAIQLDSTSQPGSYEFEFKATDRAGLDSETVVRTFVVE